MRRTYCICLLLTVFHVVLILFTRSTYVQASQEKSIVGIVFDQAEDQKNPIDPIYQSNPPKNPIINNYFPHLGQIMTSFIFILLGITCIIIFFGVISLRKVYNTFL